MAFSSSLNFISPSMLKIYRKFALFFQPVEEVVVLTVTIQSLTVYHSENSLNNLGKFLNGIERINKLLVFRNLHGGGGVDSDFCQGL
jgi:hypothetical protein